MKNYYYYDFTSWIIWFVFMLSLYFCIVSLHFKYIMENFWYAYISHEMNALKKVYKYIIFYLMFCDDCNNED